MYRTGTKIARKPPHARRKARNKFPLTVFRRTNPNDTLILDFSHYHPQKCETICIGFIAMPLVVLCDSSHRELLQV